MRSSEGIIVDMKTLDPIFDVISSNRNLDYLYLELFPQIKENEAVNIICSSIFTWAGWYWDRILGLAQPSVS